MDQNWVFPLEVNVLDKKHEWITKLVSVSVTETEYLHSLNVSPHKMLITYKEKNV